VPFSITSEEGRQILTLEAAVTVRDAQDLAAKLGEVLEYGTRVDVNTGGLEDIDTCILQLLCSLRKSVPVLSFDNPSEAFNVEVDRRGLRRDLFSAPEGL
jgi:hypothetical protein